MKNINKECILSCQDLSVGYKNKTVLNNLSLTLEPGQFISLLGPNGAGKTTLLRTMSRHLKPLAGSIQIQGRQLEDMTAMEMAQSMAIVLTEKVSPPLFTVFEFVALGRYPHTNFLGRLNQTDYKIVQDVLASVHAKDLAQRFFADLSDGERQKALVARALAQEPKLLLLDEPTLHLDLKHRMEVMTILRNLCHSQGITVVASLHDVDVAAKVSDRVVLIKDGGMSAWGIPETVLTGKAVSDLYDFRDAQFSSHLGSIEFRGNGYRGRAFVVAGMGSGATIYRMLAKRGFSICTGVLFTNDVDYHVALSLGAECTIQTPMDPINGQALAQSLKLLDCCDLVIDCGFDICHFNQDNLEILRTALQKGQPVFSLRGSKSREMIKTDSVDSLICCQNPTELLEWLNQRMPVHRSCKHQAQETMEA